MQARPGYCRIRLPVAFLNRDVVQAATRSSRENDWPNFEVQSTIVIASSRWRCTGHPCLSLKFRGGERFRRDLFRVILQVDLLPLASAGVSGCGRQRGVHAIGVISHGCGQHQLSSDSRRQETGTSEQPGVLPKYCIWIVVIGSCFRAHMYVVGRREYSKRPKHKKTQAKDTTRQLAPAGSCNCRRVRTGTFCTVRNKTQQETKAVRSEYEKAYCTVGINSPFQGSPLAVLSACDQEFYLPLWELLPFAAHACLPGPGTRFWCGTPVLSDAVCACACPSSAARWYCSGP